MHSAERFACFAKVVPCVITVVSYCDFLTWESSEENRQRRGLNAADIFKEMTENSNKI